MTTQTHDLASAFPTYPPEDVPAFTLDLEPRHWRSNACPSWGMTAANGDDVEVFADFVDPDQREFEDGSRFSIFRTAAGSAANCVLETDDETVAADYLVKARSKAP